MSSAPTPQQKNNQIIWWIVGIIGGGIALLVVLGLIVAGVVMRHVNVRQKGERVEIETPVGSIRVNGDDPHPTGLPIYPGAKRIKSEGTAVELTSKDGHALGVGVEEYATSDNLEKVSAWYVQKLGPSYQREKPGSGTHYAHGVNASDADIVYVNHSGDGARVVTLTAKSAGVQIALVRAGKKEVQ
jgi:hypothetical protein